MSCWKWLCPCSNVLLCPVVFSTVSSRTLATRHSPAVSLRGKFNKKISLGHLRLFLRRLLVGCDPVHNQLHTEFVGLQTPETWWYLIAWELRPFCSCSHPASYYSLWSSMVPAFKDRPKLTWPPCMQAGCLIGLKCTKTATPASITLPYTAEELGHMVV